MNSCCPKSNGFARVRGAAASSAPCFIRLWWRCFKTGSQSQIKIETCAEITNPETVHLSSKSSPWFTLLVLMRGELIESVNNEVTHLTFAVITAPGSSRMATVDRTNVINTVGRVVPKVCTRQAVSLSECKCRTASRRPSPGYEKQPHADGHRGIGNGNIRGAAYTKKVR